MKPLDNVLKDGKKVPDGPDAPRPRRERSAPPPPHNRTPAEQQQLMRERLDNFRRQVAPGDLRGAPPLLPGGRPGHARSSHGVMPDRQAAILNNPERIFSGHYSGTSRGRPYTREVDVYYREGSVVITEAGKKDSVITAYGDIDKKTESTHSVKPEQWSEDPHYVEIGAGDEIIFTDYGRYQRQDWP